MGGSANATQGLGRFQVLDHNQLIAPGKCAGCGGFTNRHFIDFGLELDFYGVVYLCLETCFTEVANQIGFISPVQAVELQGEMQNLVERNSDLQDKLNALENVRDAIDSYRVVDPSVHSAIDSVQPVLEGSGNEGTKAEGRIDPESEAGQSGSTESSNVDGSTGIRHDDSLDEFAKRFDI